MKLNETIPENLWFSDVFRGYQMRPVAFNGLRVFLSLSFSSFHKEFFLFIHSRKILRYEDSIWIHF